MVEPIAVPIGACRCPGKPHKDGDTVYLAPKMTIPMGIAAWHVVRNSTDSAELKGRLASIYLRFGITGWTFVDRDEPDADPHPIRWDPEKADDLLEKYLPLWEGGFTLAPPPTSSTARRSLPFSVSEGPTAQVLADWADGRLDASSPGLWFHAPDALRTILAQRHGWKRSGVRGR